MRYGSSARCTGQLKQQFAQRVQRGAGAALRSDTANPPRPTAPPHEVNTAVLEATPRNRPSSAATWGWRSTWAASTTTPSSSLRPKYTAAFSRLYEHKLAALLPRREEAGAGGEARLGAVDVPGLPARDAPAATVELRRRWLVVSGGQW